ncbi:MULTISPECIES: helix-turn-helix domain-containing protein [Exiguobacterium]|uniref:response regulator transcription factor n=1 Tax=Exiguobacterium TaxID=33986 RepID=UPI00044B6113|nr:MULTISPECIES: helix-turn-helix domain-containing protein [Exiguobacterium]EZP58625.1 AraC family transcriptional regulator [Exiguobacterium sp. RIT341]KQS38036.1 AraC family transcriptional regulator [Exiguobacterium sp. Leaf196]MDQ6468691.1 response regulator [Exiguobacterium acetylicum]MDT0173408.1 response regulator [Exiguobacterium sp. BRG2]HBF59430.1 DNA-binding response regulator [Exiguobacterium sp.]
MNVLIVDDERHVREAVKLLGEWDRWRVSNLYEAEHGEEAKRLLDTGTIDLMLTDVEMPGLDGLTLLEWTKNHHPKVVTIVLTGYDDYTYMRRAILHQSFDYLLKPVDPDVLNDALSRAMECIHPVVESGEAIDQIAKYIETHYAEELTLQFMSERFYLSREYISRRFKQRFSVNLSDYIQTIRLNRAKELLSETEARIYEIALEVGYQDDKYFRKVFKKQFGVTPNEFRELLSI